MPRLLIVEDEAVLSRHLARLFVRAGFEVTTVASCAAACRALATQRFCAMLSDVKLPDGDALDLLARVSDAHRPPRTVIMTAFATPECEARAECLKIDCVLRKPLDLGHVLHVMSDGGHGKLP